jgi:hypothetical protein
MPVLARSPLISAIRGRVGDTIYGTQYRTNKGVQDCWSATRKHNPRPLATEDQNPMQRGFEYCDDIYSNMPEAEKELWRKAVKKRHLTGYQLWMKEALYCEGLKQNLPDAPSASGGFSCREVVPGTKRPYAPFKGIAFPLLPSIAYPSKLVPNKVNVPRHSWMEPAFPATGVIQDYSHTHGPPTDFWPAKWGYPQWLPSIRLRNNELWAQCQSIFSGWYVIIFRQLNPVVSGPYWEIPFYQMWGGSRPPGCNFLRVDWQIGNYCW